ncbi:MAG TPA: hypothetical protein VFL38_14075 [Humibacillus xanthopallidus]|nr:hypothetical protein [Humibacillus xanthopallidus]
MLAENVIVPDPVNYAALTAWNNAVAAARAQVALHTANAASIAASLRLDVPSSPASIAQATVASTASALAAANSAVATAQQQQTQAQNDARTAEAAVLAAQAAEAAATKRVSDALAARMAGATTSAALSATVDGLALRERYRAGGSATPPVWDLATIPFRLTAAEVPLDPQVTLPVIGDPDHQALVTVLDDLDDSVDAIADLVAAEGIHQLVGGNLARSGAALEIAQSGTVPDDLDVVSTPVRGYDITHRVLVVGDTATAAPWPSTSPGVIGTVDPRYAAWLAGLLPDPRLVHLQAVATDDAGGVVASLDLTAAELGLDAPDWLRVAADAGELAARVARAARPVMDSSGDTPVTGPIRIAPPAQLAPGAMPLEALLAAASAARALVAGARALQASDLAASGETTPPPAADVVVAAVRAVTVAQQALAALDADLASAPNRSGSALVDVLFRAAAVGLAEATPPLAAGVTSDEALRELAAAARKRLSPRLAQPTFTPSAAGADATLEAARALLPTLLGGPVPLMLPVPLPTAALVRSDLREGSAPIAPPAAVRDWLMDHARVRPAVASLLDTYDCAETLGAPAGLRVRATQLPRQSGAVWSGTDPAPAPGLVDVVVVRSGGTTVPDAVTGLAVDAWVQTVPDSTHDAALAFHYDEPDADPPQAILVAVPPSLAPNRVPATWDLASLVGVVTSTMAQAADRAVAADLVTGSVTIAGAP